jgi:hypothetical protein
MVYSKRNHWDAFWLSPSSFWPSVIARNPSYLYWSYLFFLSIFILPSHNFIYQSATFLLTGRCSTSHHVLSSFCPQLTALRTTSCSLNLASICVASSPPLFFISFLFHFHTWQSCHLQIFIFALFFVRRYRPFYSWILELLLLSASSLLIYPAPIFQAF